MGISRYFKNLGYAALRGFLISQNILSTEIVISSTMTYSLPLEWNVFIGLMADP